MPAGALGAKGPGGLSPWYSFVCDAAWSKSLDGAAPSGLRGKGLRPPAPPDFNVGLRPGGRMMQKKTPVYVWEARRTNSGQHWNRGVRGVIEVSVFQPAGVIFALPGIRNHKKNKIWLCRRYTWEILGGIRRYTWEPSGAQMVGVTPESHQASRW